MAAGRGGGLTTTVANGVVGDDLREISYPTITYTIDDLWQQGRPLESRTYRYRVSEWPTDVPGITCDTRAHLVEVTVSDAGDGTPKVDASENAHALDLVNTCASSATAELKVEKSFGATTWPQGRTLDFELIATDADAPMPTVTTATTIVSGAGGWASPPGLDSARPASPSTIWSWQRSPWHSVRAA